LLRVEGEVLLEGSFKEESRPFCKGGAGNGRAGGVGFEEGGREEVGFCYVCGESESSIHVNEEKSRST
jgi:hypothetical protein